ncbi:MAG: hypothetical protein ACKPGT_04650, partial [Microcystis sp.]
RVKFPFIRFTNWKQALLIATEKHLLPKKVSIHTLHELEASFDGEVTPAMKGFHSYASRIGSKLF